MKKRDKSWLSWKTVESPVFFVSQVWSVLLGTVWRQLESVLRRKKVAGFHCFLFALLCSVQILIDAIAWMEYNFGSPLLSFRLKPHSKLLPKKSRLRVCSFFLCFFNTVTARARTHARKRWQMRPGRPALPCRPVCQKFAHAHAPARLRTKTVGDVLLCALNCILEKTDRSSKRLLSAFKDFDFYSNDRPKHKNSDAAKILSPILTS